MAGGSQAWAAMSSWRGDPKLFARIAEKAVSEVTAAGRPAECRIEFAVRDDVDAYDSADDLLAHVPASTLRSFSSARIRVGGEGLRVDVCFGRKEHRRAAFRCQLGVGVAVSSDGAVAAERVAAVRTAVARVTARGGFERARPPVEGPSGTRRSQQLAQAEKWGVRTGVARSVVSAVSLSLVSVMCLLTGVIQSYDETPGNEIPDWWTTPLFGYLIVATQAASYWLSGRIFPAIEIADVTPGRRWAGVVGRSGVVTAGVGVITAVAKDAFGLA